MDTRPTRVLVVEDDDDIAQVLQRSLRLEGYDVRIAGDGVQALDDYHAYLPDVMILDLGLPRLDGIEVARKLRDDDQDVPILREITWWNGVQSFYFDDPAGNLLEIANGDLWPA